MSEKNDPRVAALEAQVAALTEQVAGLKGGNKRASPTGQPSKRPEDEGVRIMHPSSVTLGMHSDGEMRQLFEISARRYPQLLPKTDTRAFSIDPDADGFRSFRCAYLRIRNLGRAARPNSKYALSWWIQEANDWLSARGRPNVEKGLAFVLAVIAQGDVGFVLADALVGQTFEFALEPYSTERPATDAWQKVLRGDLLQAMPNRALALPSTSHVRFTA
jgi:hypothetical protein